jgi:hypothetical protein
MATTTLTRVEELVPSNRSAFALMPLMADHVTTVPKHPPEVDAAGIVFHGVSLPGAIPTSLQLRCCCFWLYHFTYLCIYSVVFRLTLPIDPNSINPASRLLAS